MLKLPRPDETRATGRTQEADSDVGSWYSPREAPGNFSPLLQTPSAPGEPETGGWLQAVSLVPEAGARWHCGPFSESSDGFALQCPPPHRPQEQKEKNALRLLLQTENWTNLEHLRDFPFHWEGRQSIRHRHGLSTGADSGGSLLGSGEEAQTSSAAWPDPGPPTPHPSPVQKPVPLDAVCGWALWPSHMPPALQTAAPAFLFERGAGAGVRHEWF